MRRTATLTTLAFLTLLHHACLASFDDSTSENAEMTPLRHARAQDENVYFYSPPALIAKAAIFKRETTHKRSLQGAFSVSDENLAPASSLEITAEANIPAQVDADELQNMLDLLRAARGQDPMGNTADEILSDEMQDVIKDRLKLEGPLPADYKDIRLLKKPGIRYVILDTEWDRKRNLTEISAIEFINGKRGKIVFSKYGRADPACNSLKSFLNFIKDDPTNGLFTIVVAHNAPADKGILFHELSKHFAAANLVPSARILEHEVFTTYWFDTYHYLRRQWMISQDRANEQVKVTPVEFSFAEAANKRAKARQEKEKRTVAKKRKEQRQKEKECQLIANGQLRTDGSFHKENAPKKDVDPKKPSFKLGDAFSRTGMPMDTLVRKLNMHNGVTQEKGIKGNQFAAHNALFDITMTYALVLDEQQHLMKEYPASAVKSLKPLF